MSILELKQKIESILELKDVFEEDDDLCAVSNQVMLLDREKRLVNEIRDQLRQRLSEDGRVAINDLLATIDSDCAIKSLPLLGECFVTPVGYIRLE